MTDTREPNGWTPPYISFNTVTTLWERMAKEAPPPRIDKSYLDTFSGGYQSQVIAALQSIDLLEEDGSVTDRLKRLVGGSAEERKQVVAEVLQEFYSEPIRLGEINATQQQLEEWFRGLGIQGSTLRKAVAFYLKAAEFAGVPVSPNFKTPRVTTTTRKRRKPTPKPYASDGGEGKTGAKHDAEDQVTANVDPILAGLLAKLPAADEGWDAAERDSFMKAFESVLDYLYPVTEEEAYEKF